MHERVLVKNQKDNNHINVIATFICINDTMRREGYVGGVLQTARAKSLDIHLKQQLRTEGASRPPVAY